MTSNSGHLGHHLVLVTGDIKLTGSALTDTFQYFTSEDQHTPEAKLSDLFGLPSSQKQKYSTEKERLHVVGVLDREGNRVFASSALVGVASIGDSESHQLQQLTGFCEPLLLPYRCHAGFKNDWHNH